MQTKKGKIIAIVGVLLLFVGWCYYDIILKSKMNGSLLIDNPTSQAIDVTIDGEHYNLAPKTYINVTLSKGEHKLSCKQSNVVDEIFRIEYMLYGIINPTKSKYVRYYFVYARDLDKNRFVPYKIEDKEVYAIYEPELLTDLFIEDRTNGNDGNIDKDVPDFKDLNKFNPDDERILEKLFRIDDFFAYYNKHKND